LDSDNDGVSDAADLCPNTPAGAAVNAQGCAARQVDSDNDGVSDAADQCPNTPAGSAVNAQGCAASQLDSDNDGVNDAADQCPNTPAGATVNAQGCAATQLDADNDGVNDAADQCPNTPAGATVNAQGCAASQLDADNDGVNDAADQCPNTPTGETANSSGCSVSQLTGSISAGAAAWTDVGCNLCHGSGINSGAYPLDPFNLKQTTAANMASYIDKNMPSGSAGNCVGQCAADTAAFILSWEPALVGDPVAGKTQFTAQCAMCHGDGINKGLIPDWNLDPDNLKKTTVAELANYIDTNMPQTGPANCVGQCAADTAAYILTWEPAPAGGNAANGATLFSNNNCGLCHGANGQGGLYQAIAGKTAADLRAVIAKPGSPMGSFSTLTDAQIEDLGAYISGL
jgi:mono/diheme cytochrome c family protein